MGKRCVMFVRNHTFIVDNNNVNDGFSAFSFRCLIQ